MPSLTFLGAARSVTGSKHLIDAGDTRVLVDCGLFQGLKVLRERNWDTLPEEPSSIDAVLLTHAHIDHTGYLPRLFRDGFRGKVYATQATAALLQVMLPDSGHLQEEEAAYHNRKGTSKHRPALPLYTEKEARQAASKIRAVPYGREIRISESVGAVFRRAGHILGSAHVTVRAGRGDARRSLLFSGDLGRYDVPILPDPKPVNGADYVFVESTYGDRRHPEIPVPEQIERVIGEAVKRGGAVIIPAFAIGRTQSILYHLARLEHDGRIPRIPTYVDSPMAIRANEIYCEHPDDFDDEMRDLVASGRCPFDPTDFHVARSPEESKAINRVKGPVVIVSASGMVTGGRVLHHLRRRLPDPRTTVLLVGYQAIGTRGRRLVNGEESIRIFREDVPVGATVEVLNGLSAHADAEELLRWLGTAEREPRRVFAVHGEPEQAQELARRVRERLGWKTEVPDYRDRVELE